MDVKKYADLISIVPDWAQVSLAVLFFIWLIVRAFHPLYRYSRFCPMAVKDVQKAMDGDRDLAAQLGLGMLVRGYKSAAMPFLECAATSEYPEVLRELLEVEFAKKLPDFQKTFSWSSSLPSSEEEEVWRRKTYFRMPSEQLFTFAEKASAEPLLVYVAAVVAYDNGQYDRAFRYSHRVLPEMDSAHLVLARLYAKGLCTEKNSQEAFRHYREAIDVQVLGASAEYQGFMDELSALEVLELADDEERLALARHLGVAGSCSPALLVKELGICADHYFANLVRRGDGVSYEEALSDSLATLVTQFPPKTSTAEREIILIEEHFKRMLDSLDGDQRQSLLEEMKRKGKEYGAVGAVGAASLSIAAGGFAIFDGDHCAVDD